MVEGTENVYMLCWYQAGYEGMESDDFGLCCKFFADSEADADRQFAECKRKYPEIAEDLFVQPYNEYFDQYDEYDPYDESYNVYQNLEVWFKQAEKNRRDFEEYGDIPFEASENVSRGPVVGSMIGFDCPRCHNKGTVFDVDREVKMPYDVDYHDTCICDECASEFYAEPQYDGTMKFVDIDEEDVYSSTCVNCDTKDLTFIENKDGYMIYRRVVNDANGPHGEWFAQVNDESSDPFPITYMQAIGREDIVPSMTKEAGETMLPDQTIEGTWVYDDDDLFTTEERNLLMDKINNLLPGFAWVSGCWIDKNIITTRIETEDGYEYEVQQKIDFRKIRNSYSDIVKYAPIIADLAIQQISQDYAVEGSVYCSEELDDSDDSEDDLQELDQKYSSAKTASGNRAGSRIPALFTSVNWKPGTLNLDYGCGYDENKNKVTDYLATLDVTNVGYDKFNQSPKDNREAIRIVRANGGADSVSCSNVLNVIMEPEVRLNVLENIKSLVKPGGDVYITVYEASGRGDEGASGEDSYQLRRKTSDYLEEIQQVFPNARKERKKVIHATNTGSVTSATNSCGIAAAPYILDDDEEDYLYE